MPEVLDTPEQVAANNAVLRSALTNLGYTGLAAGVGGMGYRLLRGGLDAFNQPKPPPARTAVVDVPVPADPRRKHALLERASPADPKSFWAGHYADNAMSVPWYIPAGIAVGAGGLYGGYRLADAAINTKRKADLKDDVDEARQHFLGALQQGYKHAAEFDRLADRAGPREKAATLTGSQTGDQVLGGLGGGGVAALLGLVAAGGMMGYSRARKTDPARVEAERARRQQAERWATSPPEVLAIPAAA